MARNSSWRFLLVFPPVLRIGNVNLSFFVRLGPIIFWAAPRITEIVEVDRDVFAAATNVHQTKPVELRAGCALLRVEVELVHNVVDSHCDSANTFVRGRIVLKGEGMLVAARNENWPVGVRAELARGGQLCRELVADSCWTFNRKHHCLRQWRPAFGLL